MGSFPGWCALCQAVQKVVSCLTIAYHTRRRLTNRGKGDTISLKVKQLNLFDGRRMSACGQRRMEEKEDGDQDGTSGVLQRHRQHPNGCPCHRLNAALREVDFTLPAARQAVQSFGPGDLVVAATPVYAGRVPNKMLPYVQEKLVGGGALAVPVVTFGNRSYDNGLKELQVELEGHGFRVVAGAGVPTEHVFSAKLAPGRPNGDDLAGLAAFGRQVAGKVAALTEAPAQPVEVRGEFPAPYYTPKGTDGKPAVFLKAKPKTDPAKCNGCGVCAAVCPMGSVSAEDPSQVNGICIKCQACVKKCPTGAKYFDDAAFLSHVAMLEQNFTRPTQAEFFL